MAEQTEDKKQRQHVSPEELSRLVRIVDIKGRISVGAGLVLVLTILIWSVFGSLPQTVSGAGILVPPEGLMDVVSLGQGQVTDIRINPGDVVRQGETVARIAMPELEDKRRSLISSLNDAREMTTERSGHYERTVDTKSRNDKERAQQLRFRKAYLTDYFQFLKKHLAGLESIESGYITPKEIETTRKTMQGVLDEINDCDLRISEIEAGDVEMRSEAELNLMKDKEKVTELEQSLRNIDHQIRVFSRVVSPYDGVVVELSVEKGDYLAPGSAVAALGPMESSVEAVLLFPVEMGKRIRPGMAAYVYPSTASKEEYGCIYGMVDSVSEYPVSAESLMKTIGTKQLVASLMEQGVMIMVRVSLLRDPGTHTGLKWSSSMGPKDFTIDPGTVCQGNVVLERVRPVDLVFPKLTRMLGLER